MAASVIRIRLSCRGRVEYFDFDSRDVTLGRGERADLSIDHPSIGRRRARVLVRRGRLILADLQSATTIAEGQTFRVGEVEASASVMSASLVGRSLGGVLLTAELDAFAAGTRRYEGSIQGRRAEVMVLEDAFAPHELSAWRARNEKSSALTPELIACAEIEGRPAIAERMPLGIRLSSLIANVESERISVSREVTLAILRRLAELLSLHHAIGPHASVIPEAVHLTLDGDVLLLRSAPRPSDPERDAPWCSSNRRMNLPPSIADDAFALMRIGEALGLEALARTEAVRTRAAFEEWALGLSALSDRWGVDPSAAHVARVVRLLTDRGRPLATRSARLV